jgi:hypothetical protein
MTRRCLPAHAIGGILPFTDAGIIPGYQTDFLIHISAFRFPYQV